MSAVSRESNRSPGSPEWLPTRHFPNRPRPVSRISGLLVAQPSGREAVAAISRGSPLAFATRRPGRRTVAFGCPMPAPAPVARSRRRTSRRSPVARRPGAGRPAPGQWLPSTGLRRPDVLARSLSTRTDGCPLRDPRFDYYAGGRITPFTFSPSASHLGAETLTHTSPQVKGYFSIHRVIHQDFAVVHRTTELFTPYPHLDHRFVHRKRPSGTSTGWRSGSSHC